MKVQVIYSSLSGNTRRLAEHIYRGLKAEEKSIHDLKDGVPVLDGDVLLLGYWVDRGGPCCEMREFMASLEGRTIGVFCTLAYYADASHGMDAIRNGVDAVKDKNTVIGSYSCNGSISEAVIARFRQGNAGPHSATPENEIRWEIMKDHPTVTEMELGLERFNERLEMLRRFRAQGLEFRSVV